MSPLSPATAWAIEFAVAAALLAAWWGWSTYRFKHRYAQVCDELEPHLLRVGATLSRLWKALQNLHEEVERLFADSSCAAGLERLESVRLQINRQRECVGQLIGAPVTVELLMTDAMPTVEKSIDLLEQSLSTVLRQWDDAGDDESSVHLASLRNEHQALAKMHEELVASYQRATDRIGQLEDDLARVGSQEADDALAAVGALPSGERTDSATGIRALLDAEVDEQKELADDAEEAGAEVSGETSDSATDTPCDETASVFEELEQIKQENISIRGAVMKARAEIGRLGERLRGSGSSKSAAGMLQVDDDSLTLEDPGSDDAGEPGDSEDLGDPDLALEEEGERASREREAFRGEALGDEDAQDVAGPPPEALGKAEKEIVNLSENLRQAGADEAAFGRLEEKSDPLERENADRQAANALLLQVDDDGVTLDDLELTGEESRL